MMDDPIIQVGLLILGLSLAWLVLRFVLRLAMRVFSLGCTMILFVGVILFLMRVLQ